ncbi:MAG TPA: 50S ribosomal protein L25 [Clostridia bacterium]|nr:50S ribosomal protein L25 [Clostridia bacterium]
MSETILRADTRDETARKVRDEGFIPGVMYGTGVQDGMSVKFDELELNKVLKSQGMNPRMAIMLGEEEKHVLIKEVQRDPVRGNVIHVDLQAIAVDEVIRTTIPIVFEGREDVESRGLLLEVYLFEIEVSGPANIIPDSITMGVGESEAGDTVTMSDIELDSRISAITPLDEVLAVATIPRMEEEEDDEDVDEDVDIMVDTEEDAPEEE